MGESGRETMDYGIETMTSRKPKSKGPRVIGIRTTAEWAAWLERVAKYCRTDVAKLVDAAVADYAKAKGFSEAPPERVP